MKSYLFTDNSAFKNQPHCYKFYHTLLALIVQNNTKITKVATLIQYSNASKIELLFWFTKKKSSLNILTFSSIYNQKNLQTIVVQQYCNRPLSLFVQFSQFTQYLKMQLTKCRRYFCCVFLISLFGMLYSFSGYPAEQQ